MFPADTVDTQIIQQANVAGLESITDTLGIPYPLEENTVQVPDVVIVDASLLKASSSSGDTTCDGQPGNTMGDVTKALEYFTVHQVTGGDFNTHAGCSRDGDSVVGLSDVYANLRLANGKSANDVFSGVALNLQGLDYNNRLFILQLLQGDLSADVDSLLFSYKYTGSLVGDFYDCNKQTQIIANSAGFSSCTVHKIDIHSAQVSVFATDIDRKGITDVRLAIQKALADQIVQLTAEAVGNSDQKMFSTILRTIDLDTLYFIPNLQKQLPNRLSSYMQDLMDKRLVVNLNDYFSFLYSALYEKAFI